MLYYVHILISIYRYIVCISIVLYCVYVILKCFEKMIGKCWPGKCNYSKCGPWCGDGCNKILVRQRPHTADSIHRCTVQYSLCIGSIGSNSTVVKINTAVKMTG